VFLSLNNFSNAATSRFLDLTMHITDNCFVQNYHKL